MWQDRRVCDLLGIEHPIILAPWYAKIDAGRAKAERVKQVGAGMLSSATSVAEARCLADRGADACSGQHSAALAN